MTVPAPVTTPSQNFISAHRNVLIAASVLVFHALAIWALQTGLLMRAVEIVVPVEVLAQIIDLPSPREAPVPPAPPVPVKQAVVKPTPVTQATPKLLAVADAPPAPNAPVAQPVAPTAPHTPSVPEAATPAPAAPAKVELPSSDAEYLSNPKPPYPAMSRRLGEQGKVVIRVLIGADGLPQKAEIRQSSGFERLDQSALTTVMKWRYVPGKRGGVPEAMWFNVPVSFLLE